MNGIRKIVVLVCVALLASAVAADAQKKHPAGTKVKFFINTNVGETSLGVLVSTNGLYRKFAELVAAQGYEITHGLKVELTPDFLDSIDVLMLPIPAMTLLDSDKQALRQFIRDGGSLFVLGWYDSGVPWWDFSNVDSLIREFGITFGAASGGNKLNGSVVNGTALAGPDAVSAIRSDLGRKALLVDTAKAVKAAILEDGTTTAAYSINSSLLGKGRVLVLGDFTMLAEGSSYSYIGLEDNTDFARNIIRYLAGNVDLSVVKVVFNGNAVASYNPANVTVRIKNLGTLTSGSGKVQIILSDGASVSGAEDIKTLKTVSFSDVVAGKKKKVKTSITLPAFVGAGTYYLKVVIDYDGDSITENNIKMSAPFTVQ